MTEQEINKLSPMMQEYMHTKEKCNDCILFYRLGDFYEMFFDDAKLVSKELELTLTGKNCGLNERAPMCGIPHHAVDSYISRLVKNGHKVAICDQLEDPREAHGLVKRGITRIVTPGTDLTGGESDGSNNFIAAVYYKDAKAIGIAFADITTGDFYTTQADSLSKVSDEVSKYDPSEFIYNASFEENAPDFINEQQSKNKMCSVADRSYFLPDNAIDVLKRHFKVYSVSALGLDGTPESMIASGALTSYLLDTQMNDLSHMNEIHPYAIGRYLIIDHSTYRNLELTETIREKEKRGSLFWVLDKTKTAMGTRKLKNMIEHPLLDPDEINARLDAIEELNANLVDREEIREYLSGVYDLLRLLMRFSYKSANPRDMLAFRDSIRPLGPIKEIISGFNSALLKQLTESIDPMDDLLELLEAAIDDDAPGSVHDAGILKDGFNEEADKLRRAKTEGKQWLSDLESKEREKTGIPKLKIKYNKVFGYFIEVSNAYKDKVPSYFIRKQTLVNGERYYTPELKDLENTILGAQDKLVSLEHDIFEQIMEKLNDAASRIQKTAESISLLDALASVSDVSQKNHYVRPSINRDGVIDIRAGRHPVVEKMLSDGEFIANDTYLDDDDFRTAIITGPNMAGKSTYMRQTALIVLMAQCGFFVPADSADICICDRIFTRVGASDDLASGQSTFMVEMNEVANILKNATSKSLVILDEIGRGTSTFDGLSIAQAVVEYVSDKAKIGAKTLFATHYHELTSLEGQLDGVHNYCVAVKEEGKDVTFLRKIVPGEADRSYGIEVAKLAGVPAPVLRRARKISDKLEQEEFENKSRSKKKDEGIEGQMSFFAADAPMDDRAANFVNEVSAIDINSMTPIEAMNMLAKLKEKADEIK